MKLDTEFYQTDDVVACAQALLGKELCTRIDGKLTTGIIAETEAYRGAVDKASHAYGNKRTARTEIMFGPGGTAYIYLCYGIHSLFNLVTGAEGTPHAVLIRALHPRKGISTMTERRGAHTPAHKLTAGPGTLAQAMGLHYTLSGTSLVGNQIWIQDAGIQLSKKEIVAGPRIGVDYAGDDALLPYRFIFGKAALKRLIDLSG